MKTVSAYPGVAPGTIELRESILQPEPDQALVKIAACGICRDDVLEYNQPREQDYRRVLNAVDAVDILLPAYFVDIQGEGMES